MDIYRLVRSKHLWITLLVYRKHIKALDHKLKYIRKNESNWLLPDDTHSRTMNELASDMNEILADYIIRWLFSAAINDGG